MNEMTM